MYCINYFGNIREINEEHKIMIKGISNEKLPQN